MTMRLITGEIPFYAPRVQTGRYITPESFGFKRSGMVPVCLNHWRDNDVILANQATWALTSTGLGIMHVLETPIRMKPPYWPRLQP